MSRATSDPETRRHLQLAETSLLEAIDPAASLIDHGYLDSLSAASFLAQIEEEYGIEITEVDLVGRLASLEALARHLHREGTA